MASWILAFISFCCMVMHHKKVTVARGSQHLFFTYKFTVLIGQFAQGWVWSLGLFLLSLKQAREVTWGTFFSWKRSKDPRGASENIQYPLSSALAPCYFHCP